MTRIVQGLTREHEGRRVPVILFTKGGGPWLEAQAESGADALGLDWTIDIGEADALGLDWTIDIGEARARVGDAVALQGNMDPCVLYASPERIRQEVATILAAYGHGTGHVFNLGHGIHPGVDPEHAAAFIEAATASTPGWIRSTPPPSSRRCTN